LREVDKADLAIFNSGSIQLDDYIPPGIITQHDIIRILPNGSKVLAVEMNGSLLQRVLEQGRANRGTGGYLQTANVSRKPEIGTWLINGEPLDPNQKYRVAINDLLMSGKEKGLEFLNFKQPGVRLIAQKRDIRFAVIEQLKDSVFKSTLMPSK
jgi:5'-nucleotidase